MLGYTDGTPKTVMSDNGGNYSFDVPYNWSGIVTPSRVGYTFTPVNRIYSNVLTNQIGHNYTANAITYNISGNAGMGGAVLSYTDDTPKAVTSDSGGNYSFSVPYDWSGAVTPFTEGYTFFPESRLYTGVLGIREIRIMQSGRLRINRMYSIQADLHLA